MNQSCKTTPALKRLASQAGIVFLVLVLITSCVPARKDKPKTMDRSFQVNWADPRQQTIYSFQDKLWTDSLIPFFQDKDPVYRYLAANAFASVRDPRAIPGLSLLLNDPDMHVRMAAAFALGQMEQVRAERALTDAFVNFDTVPGYAMLNATILEALGKCGSSATLKLISEVSTYVPSDTLLQLGQARAIYRFMLRNIVHPSGTARMVSLLGDTLQYPETRLMAAHYLHRAANIDLEEYSETLNKIWRESTEQALRIPMVTALSKTNNKEAREILIGLLTEAGSDPALRVQALRSASRLPYDTIEEPTANLLSVHIPVVAGAAADFFLQHGRASRAGFYYTRFVEMDTSQWEARHTMAAALLRHLPYIEKPLRDTLISRQKRRLEETPVLAEKILILHSLGYAPEEMVFLKELAFSEETAGVRTAALQSLAKIATLPGFSEFFKSYTPDARSFIARYLSIAASEPRRQMVAAAAAGLREPTAGLKNFIPDTISFSAARDSLRLPSQVEDYVELTGLIKSLEGGQANKDSAWVPPYNHPIEWDFFSRIPDSARARIRTSYGDIVLQLLKKDAPATVVSFCKLVESGYYNGKVFHRVVPNFVIQGGCQRGDGFGSLDFTLRTEIHGNHYYNAPGMVGMASAGPHTESQQFFITHTATPHLDGKYTIFARVLSGMEVVDKIRPGDSIIQISLE